MNQLSMRNKYRVTEC